MKTVKMSLKNIKETLSRSEMKKILAGSGSVSLCSCHCNGHAGAWQGTYSTYWQLEHAVDNYCDESGANCQCNPG